MVKMIWMGLVVHKVGEGAVPNPKFEWPISPDTLKVYNIFSIEIEAEYGRKSSNPA
jgi:hypothetical protein